MAFASLPPFVLTPPVSNISLTSSSLPDPVITPSPIAMAMVNATVSSVASAIASVTSVAAAVAAAPTESEAVTTFEVVEAYAKVYQLPFASYIYVYILWITFAVIFLLFSVFHQTGGRGGYIGSLWNKWLLRRRTWRKKHSLARAMKAGMPHRQPFALPSNAQLLCIAFLYIFSILLCFVGPDYIVSRADDIALSKRDFATASLAGAENVFTHTITKSWWTSGARLGVISLTLMPLCVLFVVKAPPFALIAAPYMVQIFSDKLVFLHRWTGRLIYLITSIHVVFWSVQLAKDKISPTNGKEVWTVIFLHVPFIHAWIAFIFFTILILLSFKPIRARHFEFFYATHVLLVPLILIFAALHFPRLQWWSWATLIGWGSERLFRFAKLIWVNGIISDLRNAPMTLRYIDFVRNEQATHVDMHKIQVPPFASEKFEKRQSWASDSPTVADGHELKAVVPCAARRRPGYSFRGTYIPPPGYAHIALLPGKTIRVRLVLPHYFTWAPGQHVLLTVPAISAIQSHPFTVASACDHGSGSTESQEVVLVIRAQSGFTKALYDHVEGLRRIESRGDKPDFQFIAPNEGVLLRAYVGGPFGSSVRVRWTTYSTVVIVAGGSGVSYAASILEHVSSCVAGKRNMTLAGRESSGQITRIRFIWLVREFSYMQWVASIVRRCIQRVPAGTLQVDIYVTNSMSKKIARRESRSKRFTLDSILPTSTVNTQHSNPSQLSVETTGSMYTDVEAQINEVADILDSYSSELGHDEHVLDMTNFGGEDDTSLPGEREFSRQLQNEGELRRAEAQLRKSVIRIEPTANVAALRIPVPDATLKIPPPIYHQSPSPDEETTDDSKRPLPRPMPPCNGFVTDHKEADDMFFLSEMAHTGRPKINEILAEEASTTLGSMIVCCCGPTALIATIRKHVAAEIKPALILEGKAPMITLASEEFEN